jgi:MFS family permease
MQIETVTEGNTSTTQESGPWDPHYRVLTIGLILTIVGPAFEALAVATTLPVTVRDLGGLSLYGWAFSAFMLANLVGITIAGGEADRQGPVRPFIAGVALFALGLLIAGLAPSMSVLIAGRAVQGLGAGAVGSIAYVAVGRGYPEHARPRMLALLSSAWVVPGLIGPAIAGLIAEHAGWRWVFLGLVPLAPLAAGMILPSLRKLAPSEKGTHSLDRVWAALRLALGAGLIMGGLGQASPLLITILVLAGVALVLPSLRRLLPEGTLRVAHGLPAALMTGGVINLAFFGADAYVPLALTTIRGQTAPAAGLALTAATLTWTIGAWLQAHLVTHRDRRWLAMSGLLLIALGIAGMLITLEPQVPVLLGTVAWGIAGLGMGLAYSTTTLVVLERATPGQEGAASAAMQLLNGLGTALGTGLGGVVIARASTVGTGIAIQDLLMISALLAAAAMSLRLPGRTVAAPEAAHLLS